MLRLAKRLSELKLAKAEERFLVSGAKMRRTALRAFNKARRATWKAHLKELSLQEEV